MPVGSKIVAVNASLVSSKKAILNALQHLNMSEVVFSLDMNTDLIARPITEDTDRANDTMKCCEYRVLDSMHTTASAAMLSRLVAELDPGEVIDVVVGRRILLLVESLLTDTWNWRCSKSSRRTLESEHAAVPGG